VSKKHATYHTWFSFSPQALGHCGLRKPVLVPVAPDGTRLHSTEARCCLTSLVRHVLTISSRPDSFGSCCSDTTTASGHRGFSMNSDTESC
jgi:hypothetical protein